MDRVKYDKLKKTQNVYWWDVARRKIVLDIFESYCFHGKTGKILDVGCGMGLMLEKLSQYGEVFGMDFSPQAIEYCKEIWDETHIMRGALPDKVPFEEEYFNTIVALDVIEHIDDDKESLYKLYSLLKGGGYLLITVPALMCLWSYNDVAAQHKRRYNKKAIEDLCNSTGFQIKMCSYFNFWLFPPIFAVRKLKKILKIQKDDRPKDVRNMFINKLFYRIFSSERRRLIKGKSFPFGVSLILVAQKPK